MSRLGLVGVCLACGSRGPARACCGQPVRLSVSAPAAGRTTLGARRAKPLPSVNAARRAARNVAAFGPCASLSRMLPCCVPSCRRGPPSDPAHVRSRGAGGKDWSNVVPLCRRHHAEQHEVGVRSFELRHGLLLDVVAGRVAELVREHVCEDYPARDLAAALRCAVCGARIDEEARTP